MRFLRPVLYFWIILCSMVLSVLIHYLERFDAAQGCMDPFCNKSFCLFACHEEFMKRDLVDEEKEAGHERT